MKALIISDIHGSYKQLQTALNTPLEYDILILVGDHMYHGPRNPILKDYNPQKVADILNGVQKTKLGVRGNCDSEVDQLLLDHSMMQDYTVFPLGTKTIYITHGHLENPLEFVGSDIHISGHTHIPGISKNKDVILFNPGSIALPKENHPPTYGFLSDDALEIYSLDHSIYMSHQLFVVD